MGRRNLVESRNAYSTDGVLPLLSQARVRWSAEHRRNHEKHGRSNDRVCSFQEYDANLPSPSFDLCLHGVLLVEHIRDDKWNTEARESWKVGECCFLPRPQASGRSLIALLRWLGHMTPRCRGIGGGEWRPRRSTRGRSRWCANSVDVYGWDGRTVRRYNAQHMAWWRAVDWIFQQLKA